MKMIQLVIKEGGVYSNSIDRSLYYACIFRSRYVVDLS